MQPKLEREDFGHLRLLVFLEGVSLLVAGISLSYEANWIALFGAIAAAYYLGEITIEVAYLVRLWKENRNADR
jgi:hypothetical protein